MSEHRFIITTDDAEVAKAIADALNAYINQLDVEYTTTTTSHRAGAR